MSNPPHSEQAPVIPPVLARFHPVIARWFLGRLGQPSAPQERGWPLIGEGKDVLICAPTGSGKTLSAFLSALDQLFRLALAGALEDKTHVLYVSPLKALGNDIQKNLLAPLEELYALARAQGLNPQPIRVQVRTGDTRASERASMVARPPHILITTPESCFLYLTAGRPRETLRTVRTLIVDEIHALARDKRGSHFALSVERLRALVNGPLQLVGLSATVKPLGAVADFLTGGRGCERVEVGHLRPWEISVETPDEELSAVASHEMWGQVYARIEALAQSHRTLLIFTNTRRLAERVAHDLGERLGHDQVAAHHGSMARELRLAAEERLKAGKLRVMVATASLELGIDIGSVDLVVQLGSPRAIAIALQRIGRAGHYYGGTSRGVLFAMTRDELVECAALLKSIGDGLLDAVLMPVKPLDVLAQQIVGAVACEDWKADELFELFRRAHPYRALEREEFDQVVQMLSEGVATSRGRSRVHLHHDRVHGILRARKGARLTALTNAGAIPDLFAYPVIAEPEGKQVGTVDEDFAVESMAGDVFLLGSTSWRVQSVRGGTVRVEDAHGQAPTVPFWRGEAPARTFELSEAVGRLREQVVTSPDPLAFLEGELGLQPPAADLLVRYLRATHKVLGVMPSTEAVVAERFFDEAGGMQLIIHAPFGGRINRAWGMALRKRFCRTFDFELQAAGTDDGILLSLGEQHSFPLEEIFQFLSAESVEEVLTQALLQSPLFGTRFRWNATRALALSRFSGGNKVPPQIQRSRSDDLLAAVFPAQVGCQDNHGGADLELPDHPLVNETMDNCLREALDVDGLKQVLRRIKSKELKVRAVDLPEPSPLAHAILNSAPYTYLDDAPLEERRARAVSLRRTLPAEDAAAFGALDAAAIAQVVADAQPVIRDEEELHDALLQLSVLPLEQAPAELVAPLLAVRRAGQLTVGGRAYLVAAERVQRARALYPTATWAQALEPLKGDLPVEREHAVLGAVRGRMEICGPTTVPVLASELSLSEADVNLALHQQESVGQVLRGRFSPGLAEDVTEWCDRRLLQRIHRATVGRLRREIEPLSAQDLMRFLFRWHYLDKPDELRGPGGLNRILGLLQGYEAPAAAWEQWLVPCRMRYYLPELMEKLTWGGEIAWGRLTPRDRPLPQATRRGLPTEPAEEPKRTRTGIQGRAASITFLKREDLDWMLFAARADEVAVLPEELSAAAAQVIEALQKRGACFFTDLVATTRRLPAEIEDALWELLARGLITADAVQNLRVLQSAKKRRQQRAISRGGPGRWSLLQPHQTYDQQDLHERIARLLLNRYGILFRELAMREPLAPSWRELSWVLRRMEARGEIRGGRFVAGFAGEQFALNEAVELARQVRRAEPSGQKLTLAACDPLNLTGVITPGPRVPAILGNFVTYLDGVPQVDQPPTQLEAHVA